jgi:hypothetical protein
MRSTKNGGASTEGLAPRPPVLFIVDADRGAGIAIESALMRRFAPDYRVLSADSPEAGFEGLERLARRAKRWRSLRPTFGCPARTASRF